MVFLRFRKAGSWLAIAGLALGFSGCTTFSHDDSAPPALAAPKGPGYSFVLIGDASEVDHPGYVKNGAESACADLARTLQSKMDLQVGPPANSGEAIKTQIENAVRGKVNSIIVDPHDDPIALKAIAEASKSGIQVVTYGHDAPLNSRATFVGFDDTALGRKAAFEMVKQLPKGGSIAIYAGDKKNPVSAQRLKAAMSVFATQPKIRVSDTIYGPEDSEKASALFESRLESGEKFDGWLMVGEWPVTRPEPLTKVNPFKTKIVAIGIQSGSLAWVERGAVFYLNSPYLDGYKAARAAYDLASKDGPVPPVSSIPLNLSRVGWENLRDVARNLDAWGYENVDRHFMFQLRAREKN